MNKQMIHYDDGYSFGIGAFETIRYTDYPVFLEAHINRLNTALKNLGIEKQLKVNDVKRSIEEMSLGSCALKIVVSDENIVYTTRPLTYKEEDYHEGFKLLLSPIRRNSTSPLTYMKTLNYGDNIVARKDALSKGYNECLFLNEKDKVTEGSVSNLFVIKDNRIYTPDVSTGLLKGILRQWVMDNFLVEEKVFDLDFIRSAEGIFITNSLMGIMPVTYFEKEYSILRKIIEIRKSYEVSIWKGRRYGEG